MKARFDGKCRECGGKIYAGDDIRWSRADGARHEQEVCDSYHEQRAEMEAEAWMEARFTGNTAGFWADRDYERGVRAFNEEMDDEEYAFGGAARADAAAEERAERAAERVR